MNRVFRIIWHSTFREWIVTSELGKSRYKRNSSTIGKYLSVTILGLTLIGNSAWADECSLFGDCIEKQEVVVFNQSIEGNADKIATKEIPRVEMGEFKFTPDSKKYGGWAKEAGATIIVDKPITFDTDDRVGVIATNGGHIEVGENASFIHGDTKNRGNRAIVLDGAESELSGLENRTFSIDAENQEDFILVELQNGVQGIEGDLTNLNLEINNVTAFKLSGAKEENPTILTSEANISGKGNNNKGYVVGKDSKLIHHGSIEFNDGSNNIGIEVSGERAIAENLGTIDVTNGRGILIDNGGYAINSGSINAKGTESAAVELKNGKFINRKGTISASDGATGILITSRDTMLEIDGITFDILDGGKAISHEYEKDPSGKKVTIKLGSNMDLNVGEGGEGFAFEDNHIESAATISMGKNAKSAIFLKEGTLKHSGTIDSFSDEAISVVNVSEVVNTGSITVNDAEHYAFIKKGTQELKFENDGQNGAGIIKGNVKLEGGNNQVIASNQSQIQGILKLGHSEENNGKNSVVIDNASIDHIDSEGTIDVTVSNQGKFNSLSGDATNINSVTLDSTAHSITSAESDISGFKTISLKNKAHLTSNKELEIVNAGTLSLSEGSSYTLENIDANYSFNHKVDATDSTITIDLTDRDHKFTLDNKQEVTLNNSRLAMRGGTFDLNADQNKALGENTLVAEKEGVVTFNANEKNHLHSLDLSGGILNMTAESADNINALEVEHLSVASGSKVQIGKEIELSYPDSIDFDSDLSFFDQIAVNKEQVIVSAMRTVEGRGANLILLDHTGEQIISDNRLTKKYEGVGTAHYNNIGVAVDDEDGSSAGGIYTAYGLEKFEIDADATLTLTNKESDRNELGSQLSGLGGLSLEAYDKPIMLGNRESNYTGVTEIQKGEVGFLSDNGFGNTSKVTLNENTSLNLNGFSQNVGKIVSEESSLLDIHNGKLTIESGGDIRGEIKGNGSLVVQKGKLIIESSNLELTAQAKIEESAEIHLSKIDGLGSGNIKNEGQLYLNADGQFVNQLSSEKMKGRVSVGGNIEFTGDNSDYLGTIEINKDRTLTVTNSNQLGNGNLNVKGNLTLNNVKGLMGNDLYDDGVIALKEKSDVTLINEISEFKGKFSIDKDATLTAFDHSLGQAKIENEGKIVIEVNPTLDLNFQNAVSGSGVFVKSGMGRLTIQQSQSYTGETILEEGTLLLKENISLASPKITINQWATLATHGDNIINGSLHVNDGGIIYLSSRADETDIIRMFSTYNDSLQFGTLTIKENFSGESMIYLGGYFAGSNTITDKLVIEGDATGNHQIVLESVSSLSTGGSVEGLEVVRVEGNNSALFEQSGRTVVDAYEYKLQQSGNGNVYITSDFNDDPFINPDSGINEMTDNNIKNYRPEVGSYIANLVAANNLFNHGLRDRHYDTYDRNVWTRISGNYQRFNASNSDLRTSSKHFSLQIGNDFFSHNILSGQAKVGALFGYGHTRSTTRNRYTGYRSKGSGDGYAIGVYGTYQYEDGIYFDSSLQYVYFDNDVRSDYYQDESYKAKGLLASVEVGKTIKLTDIITLEPHAQVTWMGVDADTHVDSTGTVIKGTENNVQTRIGARVEGKYLLSGKSFRPFVELNYIHNTKPYGVYFAEDKISQAGAKGLGEIQFGANASLSKNASVWGDLSYTFGKKSYRDTRVSVGLRYLF